MSSKYEGLIGSALAPLPVEASRVTNIMVPHPFDTSSIFQVAIGNQNEACKM